ncbi:hypothetical protein B0J18DRAFT_454403 [Chaetomium sp. MPI-SDFR-AT-0129]|nr:hypothetical protein B0J18DRAFT_454403 [Chaetomium sp. MPI-SDFR-AT-0129]
MQSMQRQFGKLMSKGPGENAKVAVLLNDYEDADNVLAKVIDNARMWRDSWTALTSTQLQIVTEYEGLYDPIAGASDGQSRHAVPTPELQLERTFKLKEAYAELNTELSGEMGLIEEHILKPATDARASIAPIRKTIKKRENKRLDYEKAQDKALKLQRKPGRNAKDEAALAKANAELSRAGEEFGIADEHLKGTLPPIIAAAFSLIPPLVSNLVMIQNRLLGLYYTTLHGYCEEYGFPSPAPPMDDVIATWNNAFSPIRGQIETISFITRGKAINQPVTTSNGFPPNPTPPALTGPRRSATALISDPQARTLRVPSMPLERTRTPSPSSSDRRPDYMGNATDFTTATILGGAAVSRSANNTPGAYHYQQQQQQQRPDYFTSPSPSAIAAAAAAATSPAFSSRASTPGAANGMPSSAIAAAALGKKKPRPPPPKRVGLSKPEEWVVARYAFSSQGSGDLSFQEGDRIKVVKKTETDQDWWVGELGGVQGNFPANYCQPL